MGLIMSKNKISHDELLSKFNISPIRYHEEFAKLTQLGFTDSQANSLIFQESSNNIAKNVVSESNSLLTSPYFLTHQQIVKIAKYSAAAGNIFIFKKNFSYLQTHGFSPEQINTMGSHGGGLKNLDAVIQFWPTLKSYKFTTAQVIKIIAQVGGPENLKAVIKYSPCLKLLGLDTEQITTIAAHNGGSKNLEAFISAKDALYSLGFTYEGIFKIAANGGGSKKLRALIMAKVDIESFGLNAEQITIIVAHSGGSKNLKAFLESLAILKSLKFTAEEIIKMCSHNGGANHIKYLVEICTQIQQNTINGLPFASIKKQIVETLSCQGGYLHLKKAFLYYDSLSSQGFSFKNIIDITALSKKNLSNFLNLLPKIDREIMQLELKDVPFKTWLKDKLKSYTENENHLSPVGLEKNCKVEADELSFMDVFFEKYNQFFSEDLPSAQQNNSIFRPLKHSLENHVDSVPKRTCFTKS